VEAGAAFAGCGRRQEALFYLSLAYDTLPDHPELDPNFALSDFCGPYTLSLYNGLIHLSLGKPSDAWNGFEKFKTRPSGIVVPERIRLEIVNHQGRAAIMKNSFDEYEACLKDGLAGAVALGSKKRFDEVFNIFQRDVPKDWYKKPQLQPLIEHYHLIVP
jgi:hypothetical protein